MTLVVIGLCFHGLGIGMLLVSTFSDALRTCIKNGFPDGIKTYALVSGIWTSAFALGACIGPSISGYLYDSIGFKRSVYFIIFLHIAVAFIFIVYLTCYKRPPNMYKQLTPEENVITRNNNESLAGSTNSLSDKIPIPIERGCGMNSMIGMASSYGTKQNHWQRLEETNKLINDPTRDHITYGSLNICVDIDSAYDDIHRETIS